MEEIAIKIDGVYKNFRLPHEKQNSLKSHIIHPLRKRGYGTQVALEDISMEIKKGEFFGIVGRNGSGKSTLLKTIAGIYQPTKGSVSVAGKLVPFIELGVGFNPELTGRENVYLNGALLGFSRKEIEDQYDDIVSFAELKPFMDQKLKNYSSGMQVRLAFSMAVRAKADVLLIDEVLAVGDADFQRKCFTYFSKLKKTDTTVVFVSHNMDAVREYCDRAMLVEKSKVIASGDTAEVAEKYLQLFTKDGKGQVGDTEDRWGDGAAVTKTLDIEANAQSIKIVQTIKAKIAIEEPMAGFRLTDATGQEITGTNTKFEQKTLPSLAKGETVRVTWEFPNLLRDGEYSVAPAVVHSDGITMADWWNSAAYFTVNKSRHLPYMLDPGFKVTISSDS